MCHLNWKIIQNLKKNKLYSSLVASHNSVVYESENSFSVLHCSMFFYYARPLNILCLR